MKREKKLPDLSNTQIEIMNEVWSCGEATVSQVWESLSKQRPVARNTVHTLMERLFKKGWLKRRGDGNTYYYSATAAKSNVVRNLVDRLIDTAFGGSAEGLVLNLLQGRRLRQEEKDRIKQMIKKWEEEKS